ncbi:hypothetical protein GcC1_023017 [Golovinomyces cichoracearum]|uniref:Uncharacterized protein n=1 Tax=Golovinomyces cichoracearum TaxID=62708 RepID=A0A420J4J4_9PEZI|nr:hypothetical protein GcC1_023017 [Golovinomyces cichoracearum]
MPDNFMDLSGEGSGRLIDDSTDSETLQSQTAALQQRLSSQQAGSSTLHTPAPSNASSARFLGPITGTPSRTTSQTQRFYYQSYRYQEYQESEENLSRQSSR